MSIIDSFLSRLGYAKAKAPNTSTITGGLNYGMIPTAFPLTFPGWNPNGGINYGQTTTDTALASAWVASDLAVIAREFSTADLQVFRAGGADDEEIADHPFVNLWYAPNPFMGRSYMAQFQAYQLMLRGACYHFLAPLKGTGTIAEIWPIPAGMMQPIGDDKEFIKGYAFQSRRDQKPVVIPPEYIVYTRLPDPDNLRRGLPPVAAALGAVRLDANQSKWNADFFGENNVVPPVLVTVPRETNDSDFLVVKQEIAEYFTGGKKRFAVTRSGDLDFKILTQTLKDMEFLKGREFNRDEIDRALGFPGGYWNASATEANARHAKAVLIEHVIWPLLTLIQEDLNAQALPRWFGDEYYCAFEDIRPRNIELEIRQQDSRAGYWTIDELREVDGKPPLPDGRGQWLKGERPLASPEEEEDADEDEVNEEDQDTSQSDETETDEDEGAGAPASDSPEAEPAAKTGNLGDSLDGGEVGLHLDLARWRRKATKALKAGKGAAVAFESEAIEPAMVEAIQRGLGVCTTAEDVRRVFTTATWRKAGPDELSTNERKLYDALVDVLGDVGGEVAERIMAGEEIAWDELDALQQAAVEPVLKAIMLDGIYAGVNQVGIGLGDGVGATLASAWAQGYAFDLITRINPTTQRLVQDALSDYLKTPGMTIGDLIDLLDPAFGPVRAEMIAITETTRAAAAGIEAAGGELRKMGVATEEYWNTNVDELVCPICSPLNGKPKSEWGGVEMPAHVRCRCFKTLKVQV